jgi:uncharacterized damage-inducible protein DinB
MTPMPTDLTDRFRRWFEYEKDAHAKVLASLDTVPAERRNSPEYRKAVSILAHIVEARRVWLGRMGVIPLSTGPLFPDESDAAKVAAEWGTVQELWSRHLVSVDEKELARVFDYRSYDGGHFRNSVEEICTQLFGHSWYHRGQIAMLVRQAGGQPAATDFVYWCRQPIQQP